MSETNSGHTYFEATVKIKDVYGFSTTDIERIKQVLKEVLEEDADVEIVEITNVRLITEEEYDR